MRLMLWAEQLSADKPFLLAMLGDNIIVGSLDAANQTKP